MWRFLLPVMVFLAIAGFLYAGLDLNPQLIPSPLINKPAPDFDLPTVNDPARRISRKQLLGQEYLLNVWASWCVACREEHNVITAIAQSGEIPVYGLNYKDTRKNATRWLAQFGDPYVASAHDLDGRTGIDFGVYGAPETFLVDAAGNIRYKFIGVLTPEVIEDEIWPLVATLRSTPAAKAEKPAADKPRAEKPVVEEQDPAE
ncbi:MAG: DsbE family thiol:disulfide interchange protein [Gammaproteobacteria bacterium]|nr:MAG: DsbE family thiol:disulfide interchange protein [Gammaproteobacteria bacterium]